MDIMPQSIAAGVDQDQLISRIGHLTRLLRDSLHELGLDQTIQDAAQAIPDARDRLRYVARMTEQAATSVLAATEEATPLQDTLGSQGKDLKSLVEHRLSLGDDPLLEQVCRYLDEVEKKTGKTNELLMQIMMAQGFQDLTGQVIMKMMDLVGIIEKELIEVLVQSIPPHKRSDKEQGLLNGPQINPNAPEVVSSQDQVDDLLDSLGF